MKPIKLLILTLSLSLCLSALSCGRNDSRSETFYEYFDTVCTVSSYANEGQKEFAEICDDIENSLSFYHRLFDIYHEYEGVNNLATINKNAGISPVTVPKELIDFLLYSNEIYTLTNGEVNIAMGSVLSLWHDCREDAQNNKAATIPTDKELKEAAEHTSIETILIDTEKNTVYITDKDTSIDAGAIAKGYATEMIAKELISLGISSYVLNFGGNIRIIGTKQNGDGWITGITNPDKSSSDPFVRRLTLRDTSCVTSGSYERYFTANGKDYHHIIDKDTLYPSEHFASVSIITESSALADALSTALFNMTYEEGLALCQRLGNVSAIWVTIDGKIYQTEDINAISV